MRKKTGGGAKDRRSISIMSRRVDRVLHDIVMPLARISEGLPRSTSFLYTAEDLVRCCLHDVRDRYPSLFADRSALMSAVKAVYKDMRRARAISPLALDAGRPGSTTPRAQTP